MNNIDKNIFNNYETVETALLNELATEVKTKGKKARTVKGEGYYVKYDGVKYDITAEQCRIHRLIRNNYNMFAEQLNSAKSDILGVWKNVWGERLPAIIADLEKGIEICQKYFDAFKSYITKEDVETVADEEKEETVEDEEKEETETSEKVEETETSEKNDETSEKNDETSEKVEETNEKVEETETSVAKMATYCQEEDTDEYVAKMATKCQDQGSCRPQNSS